MADKPRVYIFHGEAEEDRRRAVQKMRAMVGDSGQGAPDVTVFQGENLTLGALSDAALTIPFLASRRLVIVRSPLKMPALKSPKARERFLAVLESVPPTTALVLEIPTTLKKGHWLLKWAEKQKGQVLVRAYGRPANMVQWILKRAKEEGGEFTVRAASELARRVEGDTTAAVHEIAKLLAFVGYARPVDLDDVRKLTPAPEHPNIFEMVDALGLGRRERALNLLRQLLKEEEAPRLWGMVIRQFRLLILAREAISEGIRDKNTLSKRIGVHPFVAEKLLNQARRFDITTLERIYAHLWEADRKWKTGKADLETSLDLLIVSPTEPKGGNLA